MKPRRVLLALILSLVVVQVLYLNQVSPLSATWPIKDYVLSHAYSQTGAENTVTAIYLTYRYYDTLFEGLMVIFAIVGVVYLSFHHTKN
tara:strand:+ start:520 stop:786 length:267 start_codon:yes stop_codon:yes gene_type:complete